MRSRFVDEPSLVDHKEFSDDEEEVMNFGVIDEEKTIVIAEKSQASDSDDEPIELPKKRKRKPSKRNKIPRKK